MSEEALNNAMAVPYGIMMATGSTLILGFVLCIAIAFCGDPNICESYRGGNRPACGTDQLRHAWQERRLGIHGPTNDMSVLDGIADRKCLPYRKGKQMDCVLCR
jgi:hypothetical protein